MDIKRAKEILSVLADGINPITGEVLPDCDSCNQADVVRALHSILIELEKQPKKKHSLQPENAGKRWTDEEDKKLSEMFDAGISKKEICNTFKRTSTGIASRLVRLGKIRERDEFRNRK